MSQDNNQLQKETLESNWVHTLFAIIKKVRIATIKVSRASTRVSSILHIHAIAIAACILRLIIQLGTLTVGFICNDC